LRGSIALLAVIQALDFVATRLFVPERKGMKPG